MTQIARLHFADGVQRDVPVPKDATLLSAALEAGVKLEHQCLSGSCGTCVCRLTCGDALTKRGRSLSLLPSEVAGGYRLACSVLPEGDTEWQFDYPSTITDERHVASTPAQVEEVRWLSETVLALKMRVSGDFTFQAGQYVRIKLPDGTARSISMASPAEELPVVQFLIRYLPSGALSEYLKDVCRPGDVLDLEGPLGSFVLPRDIGPALFVAGGTGLAPVLAMLDHLRLSGRARAPMVLCFGVGRQVDLFHRDEIELRQFWMPKLTVRLACDDADPTAALRRGNVVSLLEPTDIGPQSIAFLCGPPAMVAAASERLQQLGLPAERIVTERFNAS
jgi:NAD(P)H-flavin reductase/ferredoxin